MEIGSTETSLLPRVGLGAMADIVRDLLAGGQARLQDEAWLQERLDAAGLSPQETGALEDLCAHLRVGGAALLRSLSLHWG